MLRSATCIDPAMHGAGRVAEPADAGRRAGRRGADAEQRRDDRRGRAPRDGLADAGEVAMGDVRRSRGR